MGFFKKVENGWKICDLALKVLNANKKLIIFPILSGISLIIILTTFFVGVGSFINWDASNLNQLSGSILRYLIIFLVYLINYVVIIFFNIALMHCTRLYFEGEEVNISTGIKYSLSRFGYIVSWALFASTVGLILKIIQDNVGKLGRILIALLGFAWSVSTFFVVPIVAYENRSPWDAFKESIQMMKKLWGESLTASFSFGLIQFGVLVLVILFSFLLGMAYAFLGIGFFIIGLVLTLAVFSTLNSIFISAVYHKVSSDIDVKEFSDIDVASLFSSKK
jgi:hypothetical protein